MSLPYLKINRDPSVVNAIAVAIPEVMCIVFLF